MKKTDLDRECINGNCTTPRACIKCNNCLGGMEVAQRNQVLAVLREEDQVKVPTVMTETFDPSNGKREGESRIKVSVLGINTFPDGVVPTMVRIGQGETLNKAPGTYEMARYDCSIECGVLPKDRDAAIDELEAITGARVEAFRKKIKAGITPPRANVVGNGSAGF